MMTVGGIILFPSMLQEKLRVEKLVACGVICCFQKVVIDEQVQKLDEAGLIEWSKNGVPRIKNMQMSISGRKYRIFGIILTQLIHYTRRKRVWIC